MSNGPRSEGASADSLPVPKVALSAFALARSQFDRVVDDLAGETLAAMNLKQSDGWRIDFHLGVAIREQR